MSGEAQQGSHGMHGHGESRTLDVWLDDTVHGQMTYSQEQLHPRLIVNLLVQRPDLLDVRREMSSHTSCCWRHPSS